MNDTVIITLGLVTLVLIGGAFIAYMFNTNRIIREQEKEIARLQTALRRKEKPTTISEIKQKHPEFGGF